MKSTGGSHVVSLSTAATLWLIVTVIMLPLSTTARELTPRLDAVYIEGTS